ncbi:Galactosyltransferase family protein [Actinidia rufa]|uniref:Hexosyltransferase n=1 Tax=Actinidia rufa TaxID=165716 RepID=A0A7J0GG62_9ERIC|nr:Galactosyltransferase family protein [Actinidia rufa]
MIIKDFAKPVLAGFQNLTSTVVVWPWLRQLNHKSKKMRVKPIPAKLILMLCIASFLAGSLFTCRKSIHSSEINTDRQKFTTTVAHDSDHKRKLFEGSSGDIMGEVMKTHQAIQSLDKTISTLEMELAVARARKSADSHLSLHKSSNQTLQKVFAVIGINTAFSSKKRRNSLRETWMPKGDKLKKLEREKGIIIRFVIGHSATPGGVLDRAIDAEEAENKDFLRLKHVEGYHELSTKTRLFFSTVISIWDAEFYVKVDDDVHLNLDCELKTKAGNVCVASFDWSCSGICKSVERMKNIHTTCGEGDGAVWNIDL